MTRDEPPATTTLYYDPIVDVHHLVPMAFNVATAFYVAPQVPDEGRELFEAGCRSAGWDESIPTPLPASRAQAASLVLAREWELADLEQRLVDAIEASFEPTWELERPGEFTWGMGLDEPHPRGQFNAFLAAAEAAGPGRWTQLSAAPLEPCPQIEGVDFPAVALRRAEWRDDTLHLSLAPTRESPDRTTSFRLVGHDARSLEVDGIQGAIVDVADTITITTPMVSADFVLRPTG